MFFTKPQFIAIATMQNEMQNLALGTNWKEQITDYATAIHVESAEACDHYGWKWWAKQDPNLPQAAMECVDILHFAMCGVLQQVSAEDAYEMLQQSLADLHPAHALELDQWSFISFMKECAVSALVGNFGFSLYLCVRAAAVAGMDSDQMFTTYVGKNALNRFRKANGYKDGTYIKTWYGEEDNVVLDRYLKECIALETEVTSERVQEFLANTYKTVTATTH